MRPSLKQMDGEVWMELKDHKKFASILVIQEVTHRALARAAGYSSHSYIGRLVRGEEKTLRPEAAVRIAKFLGHPVDDLFVTKVSSEAGRSGQKSAA